MKFILCLMYLLLNNNYTSGQECSRIDAQGLSEDFEFELRNVYTDRQSSAVLNIIAKYRYHLNDNPEYKIFDHNDMKNLILKLMPANSLLNVTCNSYWEIVNREISLTIWKIFPIKCISIRLEILPTISGHLRASTTSIGQYVY